MGNDKNILFRKLTEKRRLLSQQLKNPAAAGFWNMVMDKYSDQAHFIYELLQNADDAGATEARITLRTDRFIFIHNGTVPFTITDPDNETDRKNIGHLNAITSIGASTKQDGNTIGKFGVGFKSVFQYTDTPHVEDNFFSFRIVDFIVPEEEANIESDRKASETLFSIPFKNSLAAFSDIENKLATLNKPLLFLKSLRKIQWISDSGLSGLYSKEEKDTPIADKNIRYAFITLQKEAGGEKETRYLHTFSRQVSLPAHPDNCKPSGTIAYYANEDGSLITDHAPEPAFCFFPTKEATGLNMLIHAPFLLTDSRESIKYGEEWNKEVIDHLARLAADGIELLCTREINQNRYIINDNLFEIIPIEKNKFFRKEKNEWKPTHPFYPFYIQFKKKLSEAPVFLSEEKNYVKKTHTRYASEKSINKLFTSHQLATLSGNPEEAVYEWSFGSLYPGNNAEKNEQLRKSIAYLQENGFIRSYITPDYIACHITADFIQQQPVEWLQEFYSFLGTHKSLWADADSPLRYKPFILCADGMVRAPFTAGNDKAARIYLSVGTEGHFPAVHPDLLVNGKCLRFFESHLGLQHPGLPAEIELFILPHYRRGEIQVTDHEHIYSHQNSFVECFTSFSFQEENRNSFLKLFEEVSFLPVTDNSGILSLQPPGSVYFDTPAIRNYLKNFPNACYLDNNLIKKGFLPEKRETLYRFLTALGVSFGLKIKEVNRQPKKDIHARLNLNPKSLRRYDKGAQKITDKEIEGFADFIKKISPESSNAFFNLLIQAVQEQGSFMFRLSLEGEYQYIEKSKHAYTTEKIWETTAFQSLFKEKWLFDKNGERKTVSEIASTDYLAEIYDRSCTDLFFLLGIPHDATLTHLTADQRKAVLLMKELEKKGVTTDILESLSGSDEAIEQLKKYIDVSGK